MKDLDIETIDCGAQGDFSAGFIASSVDVSVKACFGLMQHLGWWTDLDTGISLTGRLCDDEKLKFNVPEKLMLIVSEISEAMEGYRKTLMDDKLPHRPMLEVELADAYIRICDLAGGLKLDLAGAVAEKLLFNSQREDHTLAHRQGEHGKKF